LTQKRRDDEARASRLGQSIPAGTPSHAEVSRPDWKPTPTRGGKQAQGLVSRAKWFCPECTAANAERTRRGQRPIDFCNHRVHYDDPDQHPDRAPLVEAYHSLIEIVLAREDATVTVYLSEPEDVDHLRDALLVAGLSEQEARAWQLRCEGFRPQQIARYMDRVEGDEPLSPETVKTYLRRGREKLRKAIAS